MEYFSLWMKDGLVSCDFILYFVPRTYLQNYIIYLKFCNNSFIHDYLNSILSKDLDSLINLIYINYKKCCKFFLFGYHTKKNILAFLTLLEMYKNFVISIFDEFVI